MSARMPAAAGGLAALVLALLWMPAVVAQEVQQSGASSDRTAEWLDTMLHWTIRGIEIVGIATIVIGAAVASAVYLLRTAREGATGVS